ncbi:MAG: Uma2 family endonuclease [Gammaproteobacteria bacterium]|nr:Uma2 family endonuclease [Gammaproteobacteria bacterium]
MAAPHHLADTSPLGADSYPTEIDYLRLTDRCNRLLEFADGRIEELREPTDSHQSILMLLFRLFDQHVGERGVALVAPLRIRIREGRYREPDLLLLRDANDSRRQDRYWLGADLVVEVVSRDDPERDYVQKRHDYADLRIPEYWIVDPQAETITVLTLDGDRYVDHGVFRPGDVASSTTLRGFRAPVSDTLSPARGAADDHIDFVGRTRG